ncbi:regulatory protein RecX [Corynebacterium kozikiae]|uniref:regulatory protein RecX n=1 Tax=Corynebacterium kozikiae TaxID=2968469 RepID=UPI00211CA464|nr:regulatory protein RecX [Corynebacterium sp. 76QC2CO]MCQ9342438.1 recombination regulator RecX [Corynebacterium sp. 76QC2CO]
MTPKNNKIEQLRAALESYTPAQIDVEAEQQKTKIRNRALLLLDQRARSRKELEQRLGTLEFPESQIAEVLDDLERVGLINDAAFAHAWVTQRRERRGKFKRALRQELRQKGVHSNTAEEALAAVSDADERELARTFAQKKARTFKETPTTWQEQQKQLQKVVGYLARRGFPEYLAMEVAREAIGLDS